MKILNNEQVRAADAATITNEPVSSVDLMERACQQFVDWFIPLYQKDNKIIIVCSTGNNGGDGLAIARLLTKLNYAVKVKVIDGSAESPDFTKNLNRLNEIGIRPDVISAPPDENLFSDCTIIIDAVFGSGLSRPLNGLFEAVIERANQAAAIRIAVDVPSGLFTDKPSSGIIFKADQTLAFQIPKLAFMFPENGKFVGSWHLGMIHLNESYLNSAKTPYYYTEHSEIKHKLHKRSKFDNKGSNGKALLIAGSHGKMGACVLAAKAALRSGLGLLTLHVPQTGYEIVQTAVPEAMAVVDHDLHNFTESNSPEKYTVIGVGPGIGTSDATRSAFEKVLQSKTPMVIDADALNMMGSHRNLLKLIPSGSILSPHPKEFERLTEKWSNDFVRLEMQKSLAAETNSVIILKGAHTSVATPDGRVYFNSTGNPGMAKGGSGDVLTGILTGLLAQGYSAEDAAIVGVYIHGMAGDIAAAKKSENAMIATDLIDALPLVFKKIEGSAQ